VAEKDDYLVDILVDLAFVSAEKVAELRREAAEAGVGVVDLMVANKVVRPADVTQAKAAHFGAEVVNLSELKIADDVIATIPRHIARKYRVVPVYKHDNSVTVALADPSDLDTIDSLAHLLHTEVELRVASETDIEAALSKYYAERSGGLTADPRLKEAIEDITREHVEIGWNDGVWTIRDCQSRNGTFVDGVACRVPDPDAVARVVAGCSRVVRVSEADAAAAMGISVPRYYLWEQRALEGLVAACEPRGGSKIVSSRCQIQALEKEVVRLKQECARQQALVRATQRTIGLAPPPVAANPPPRDVSPVSPIWPMPSRGRAPAFGRRWKENSSTTRTTLSTNMAGECPTVTGPPRTQPSAKRSRRCSTRKTAISAAFSPASIMSGGASTLTLTVSNSNASALTGGAFTDTLANMSAVGGTVGGTCAGTTPGTLTAGQTSLSFTGITIPASGSCTVAFSVTSATVGSNANTPSGVTATQTTIAGSATGATLTVSTAGSSSTIAAGAVVAGPGGSFSLPVTLNLSSGVTVNSLAFGVQITPAGTAPAFTGTTLSFTKDGSIADAPIANPSGSNGISVMWGSLTTALSGTSAVGLVTGTIPVGAMPGQSYTVAITGPTAALGNNTIALSAGANGTLTVGYFVGDVYPYTGDTAADFGDRVLNILDLKYVLFAATNIGPPLPAACSDRYDAMDTYPLDTATTRGGDGAWKKGTS